MIRKATIDDIPVLVKMAEKFCKEIGNDHLTSRFSQKHAATLLNTLVTSGICYVAEKDGEVVGVTGGMVSPNIWNPSIKQVDEVIFYLRKKARGSTLGYKMIKAYAEDASEYELSTLKLMHTSPALDKAYNRLGYYEIERSFMKSTGG